MASDGRTRTGSRARPQQHREQSQRSQPVILRKEPLVTCYCYPEATCLSVPSCTVNMLCQCLKQCIWYSFYVDIWPGPLLARAPRHCCLLQSFLGVLVTHRPPELSIRNDGLHASVTMRDSQQQNVSSTTVTHSNRTCSHNTNHQNLPRCLHTTTLNRGIIQGEHRDTQPQQSTTCDTTA
jgi:hypothetical protein